jgi:16S rRNA (uracil1498-N3)-methyltransferase
MSHRFFLPQKQIKHPMSTVTGADVNHIKNVLRLKLEDHIILFDGTGVEYIARIVQLSSNKIVVELIDKRVLSSESPVHISIAQAFLKEKKMDLLIRQVTELGINYWQPFFSERSIPTPDHKRMYSRVQRWEKIMTEAVKQCRRSRLMEIGQSVSFDELMILAKDADIKIIFWENADSPLSPNAFSFYKHKIRSVYSMIGPEGGFSANEVKHAVEAGFVPVGIGPRILRAETAAVSACTLLQYLFGDFGQKGLDKKN